MKTKKLLFIFCLSSFSAAAGNDPVDKPNTAAKVDSDKSSATTAAGQAINDPNRVCEPDIDERRATGIKLPDRTRGKWRLIGAGGDAKNEPAGRQAKHAEITARRERIKEAQEAAQEARLQEIEESIARREAEEARLQELAESAARREAQDDFTEDAESSENVLSSSTLRDDLEAIDSSEKDDVTGNSSDAQEEEASSVQTSPAAEESESSEEVISSSRSSKSPEL